MLNKKFKHLCKISIFPSLMISSIALAEPFTVDSLNNLNQIHDIVLSPKGDVVVYGIKKGSSAKDNHLYIQEIKTNQRRQLTSHEKSESNVVFSSDGTRLYFLSERSGTSQIWQLALAGGEAKQVTDLALDINGFKLGLDGKTLALAMTVKPGCEDLACTIAAQAEDANKKHQVRVYNQLMVRHWDTWTTDYKEHIFVAQLLEDTLIKTATDLIPNWTVDIAGIDQVSINPSGELLAFSAKSPAKDEAWSTNFDIFEVDLTQPLDKENQVRANSSTVKTNLSVRYKITNITEKNHAWDASPVYSDDGRFLAYLAMSTPAYESDKFSIKLRDNVNGKTKDVAKQWDRSVKSFIFANDNRSIYATAQDLGQVSIFEINPEFGDVRTIYNVGTTGDLNVHGDNIYFSRHTLNSPQDIFAIEKDGYGLKQLTEINKDKLASVDFAEYEQFSFKGWNNETVHGYWLKPANVELGKKYPLAYLVHGGPQGSFGNMFNYRWNAQLWAAQGYAVVMVDFHGSTGYGQAFTDSIARDWGGKPFEDLQKGLGFIIDNQSWIDGDNVCALGASYGGYMMNWFAGNWSDRFKCIVNHAGLYDMPSFYQSTEELWFPEHDLGGTPWRGKNATGNVEKVSEDYNKFNPSSYAANWKTPMLVIQGELDYRVPYAQSLGAFTTLQRQGIESRLVMFPTEDHHIKKPENLVIWYQEVFKWMNQHLLGK